MSYRILVIIFSLALLSCNSTPSLAVINSANCTGSSVLLNNDIFDTSAPVRCEAQDVITTQGSVKVPQSADVELISNNSVILSRGFHVSGNSIFRATAGASRIPVNEFFVDMPKESKVRVTLHPGATVRPGEITKVAFGVPFPRATVDSINQVIIADSSGQEVASHIVELARWRSLKGNSSIDSLRSALIYVDVVFSNTTPITMYIKYGKPRTLELGPQPDPKTLWVPIANGPFPEEYPESENILEPAVYATFPPDWLSATLIRGRTFPANSVDRYEWFDNAYKNFSLTAVNDVSDYVYEENKVDYLGVPGLGPDRDSDGYEPWLFDRSMTLFGIYIRTGSVKWLRHAHRSTQYYANHITPAGYFDKKPGEDFKYSYGQSMFVDMMLTGDTSLIQKIENVASAGDEWNETYDMSTRFWTERHQTYALLAALSAWEATGLPKYANRANQVAEASFNHALNPVNGWAANGSMPHTKEAHEGWGGEGPVASPWMSSLMADAIMRYYIHSEDQSALVFLSNLGDFILEDTTTYEGRRDDKILLMPYYLIALDSTSQRDQWHDTEHTCDVAGLAAKASWARKKLGKDNSALINISERLLSSCQWNLDNKHREGADINYGLTVWRLGGGTTRQYSWWFGSTHDMLWMLEND
ncbi:hypothetical protein [Thiolapillus sp.]